MKVLLKWIVSIAIGGLFVWLSSSAWPDKVFTHDSYHLEGTILVAGDITPEQSNWYPADSPEAEGRDPVPQTGWTFDLLYMIPYALILVLIHFLRVARWYPLLRPITKVGFWKLNRVGAVGFMSVFVFPLRLGEFVRPLLIAEPGRIRVSEAMATIVVERVCDGLMTSLLLFFVLFFLPDASQTGAGDIRSGSYIALGVFVGALIFLVVAYWRREWTIRMIRRFVGKLFPRVAERVIGILEAFLRGLSILPDWRNLAQFLFLTAVYWGINGVGLYIFVRGFGLHVPLVGAYAMMAAVVVGMMIPNSPANVGSFWYFLLMPLALYGLGAGANLQATGAALGIWLMQLTQLFLFAGWFLLRGKVSLRDLWSMTTGGVDVETSDETDADASASS